MKNVLKNIVFNLPFLRKIFINQKIKEGKLLPYNQLPQLLDDADEVLFNIALEDKTFNVGLVKDKPFYEDNEYVDPSLYYPKYERFLKKNNIKFEYYDIYAYDWLEKANLYDVIIWRTDGNPMTQETALNKIYVLDKIMNKICFPSFHEVWTYEEKINAHYLYSYYNLPQIPTFVSHSKEDALDFIKKTEYPIISKIVTGASSKGVKKINTYKDALTLVNQAFSSKGIKTFFPYIRQKNYVYFQQFIRGAEFDLRVMVIGNKLLGYYRLPNEGDYRASGAGNYVKKEIPVEALDLAFKTKALFNTTFLATDMLYSKDTNEYLIIESSLFIGVDTPEQLVINNVPGYYERLSDGNYIFKEGRFWVQELVLLEFFKKKLFDGEN